MRLALKTCVLTGLAALAAALPAQAQSQIGTAAAVVPQATGAPPQQQPRVLQVGLDMVQNERVQTGERGRTQLLFLDGTALTVGPNSDLVLDEYVYNPDAGTGSIALSATRGVFRVVGGKISKANPVTIRTPTVTVGVRGGVAFLDVGATVSAAFVFGDQMTVAGGGRTESTTRPGTEIVTPPDGVPNPPRPLSDSSISNSLDATEGEAGAPPGGPSVGDEDVAETQIGELTQAAAPPTAPESVVAPPLDSTAVEQAADQTTASQMALVEDASSNSGGVGPFRNLVGRYKTSAVPGVEDGTADNLAAFNIPFIGAGIVNGRFSASLGASSVDLLTFPVNPDANGVFSFGPSGATDSPFGPITGSGWLAAAGDFGFIEYTEDDFPGFRGIAFFGTPAPATAFTTGVMAYSLRDDFVLGGSKVPFIPASLNGDIGPGGVLYIDLPPDPTTQDASVLGGRVVISGQGGNQRWAASVLVGSLLKDSAGRPFIEGEMRGSTRRTPSTAHATFFDGPVASSDAGDGSDFFGSRADFVLESRLVDGNDLLSAENVLGVHIIEDGTEQKLIYPNAISRRLSDPSPQTRTSRTMFFETAGISQDDNGVTVQNRRFGTNESTPGMITLTAGASASVSAFASLFSLDGGFTSPTMLRFGEPTGVEEESAFVSDSIWGATESSQSSTVGGGAADFDGAIVSSSLVALENVLPMGVSLCACQFVEWGFWGGETTVGSIRHEFALIPFAAGQPVLSGQFNTTTSATYTGHAMANFYDGTNNFIAAGGMTMATSFVPGSVSITNLDVTNLNGNNLNFNSGGFQSAGADISISLISASGPAGFDPMMGGAGSGSIRFAGPGTPPENTYGHFAACNSSGTILAAGVVMGARP